MQEGDLVT